jgi:hypothetical protein
MPLVGFTFNNKNKPAFTNRPQISPNFQFFHVGNATFLGNQAVTGIEFSVKNCPTKAARLRVP